jgi:hypothetical protein
MFSSAPEALIRGVQVLFKHKKQWSLPFGFGLPRALKCYSCNSIATLFATKKQLKTLTHMFCFQIPSYKLCKKGLFSHIFKLKYKSHFGMSSKSLTQRQNIKLKKIIHGYSSVHLIL